MSDAGGRHTRSTSGLVGAMLVTLLLIGAFVLFRACGREDLVVSQEPVDYRAAVRFAQEDGARVAYPRGLPPGWRVTSIDAGGRAAWGMGMLTPKDEFVGVRLESRRLGDLLDTYVDEAARRTGRGPAAPGTPVETWQQWEDDGGDTAYSAPLGRRTLLVYGSDAGAVAELAGRITTDPLPAR